MKTRIIEPTEAQVQELIDTCLAFITEAGVEEQVEQTGISDQINAHIALVAAKFKRDCREYAIAWNAEALRRDTINMECEITGKTPPVFPEPTVEYIHAIMNKFQE